MAEIVFANRLIAADWDDTLRGWRCPALNIPGAVVQSIIVDGNTVDKTHYEVLLNQTLIRWILPDRPERIAAIIQLTETLSLVSDTDKWKRLAIVLPVLATVSSALISATATYYSKVTPKDAANTVSLVGDTKEKTESPVQITSDTQFSLWMPRGDKVCLSWKGQPTDGSGERALKNAGISIVDFNQGTKIAYAALTQKGREAINYIPLFIDGKPVGGFCQAVLNAGPIEKAGYEEFQLFQGGNEFTIFFNPIDRKLPPVSPEKIGVEWDKVREGLRLALKAIHKSQDFEFGAIDVLTKADGRWEYRLPFLRH